MNFVKSDPGVKCLSVAVLLIAALAQLTLADDSPQFRGPNRDGCSNEKNLLKIWPEAGPNLLWSIEGLGTGWSSPAIADGLLFITGMDNEKNGVLFAYDLAGILKWKKTYGPEWTGSFPGARTTPTVDGDRVYVVSGNGNLVCFDAKSGREIWAV
ncbi:MAG: PQQ-binding-like beta-propeller repeat protein, partial [Phycisphaerae bacterium]|nr:PQQ-binding-like beta-propeller repeat protein [Phycisphaerae bacterium]